MANSDFFHMLSGGLFFDKKRFSNDIQHFQKVKTPVPIAANNANNGKKQKQSNPSSSKKSQKQISIKGKEREDDDEDAESEDDRNQDGDVDNEEDRDLRDEEDDDDDNDNEGEDEDDEEDGNEDEQDEDEIDGDDQTDENGSQIVVRKPKKIPIKKLRKQFKIKASGTDVPSPFQTFEDLESKQVIRKYVLRNIKAAGIKNPTPIQMQAVPVMLKNRDLIACAPTGSGKTLAFILPILAALKKPAKLGFRALVLSPTRELAQQTHREFERIAEGKGWRIVLLTKATANTNNLGPNSSQRFDILIATPLRLIQLIQSEGITFRNLQMLVLDEADKLFDLGFLEQIDEVINACMQQSNKLQKAMFSATMMPAIEALALTILNDPIRVTIGAKNAATATIKQKLVFVGSEEGKILAIRQQIQEGLKPPILIFVQSKERANDLFRELVYEGINVDVISADRTKAQRDAIVTNFRSGKLWVLIATDLMARGIDFKGVSCVINYDFPQTVTQYIHRIGRTGRAGREGESITFYTEDDVEMIRTIANVMKASGCEVPEWILKLKPPSRNKKRERAKRPIARDEINPVPKFDKKKANKKRMYIESTKRSNESKNSNSQPVKRLKQ